MADFVSGKKRSGFPETCWFQKFASIITEASEIHHFHRQWGF
jgi:hypothetical protein